MSRSAGDLVRALAAEIGSGDSRRLSPFLTDDIEANFDEAGRLTGKRSLLAFWRRIFQIHPVFEMHVVKLVAEGPIVIVETIYVIGARRGPLMSVRAISLFEIGNGLIERWTDHADLASIPSGERERWRRLGAARW